MQQIEPYGQLLVASGSKIADGNSGTLEVPLLDDYTFFLDVTAVTGTTPTLDLNIQITPDKGTTWFTVGRFIRSTTTGTGLQKLTIFPTSKGGSATVSTDATKAVQSIVTDANAGLGGFAPMTSKLRVLWDVSGTSPDFTFSLWVVGNPRQSN